MDPITGFAVAKGASALGKYVFGKIFNKKRSFDQTPYAQRLKTISERGMYSPQMKREILGETSNAAANVAQKAKTDYKGRLYSLGLGGSIAGQSKLADIDAGAMEPAAEISSRLERENALSKIRATNEYAAAKGGYQDKIRALRETENRELIGGLMDAAGTYAGGKLGQASWSNLNLDDPKTVSTWLSEQPDKGAAIDQLYKMSLSDYYGGGGRSGGSQLLGVLSRYRQTGDKGGLFASLAGLGLDSETMLLIASALEAD